MSIAAPPSSGLGYLEAVRDGLVAPPPAAEVLGLELREVRPGRAVLGFVSHARFANPVHVHGGILAALADFAASTAVLSAAPDGHTAVTTDLTVTYLRPAPIGPHTLTCVGSIVHLGRSQARASVEIVDEEDRLVVVAGATCRLLREHRPS